MVALLSENLGLGLCVCVLCVSWYDFLHRFVTSSNLCILNEVSLHHDLVQVDERPFKGRNTVRYLYSFFP
jgi:hypothetical protein